MWLKQIGYRSSVLLSVLSVDIQLLSMSMREFMEYSDVGRQSIPSKGSLKRHSPLI